MSIYRLSVARDLGVISMRTDRIEIDLETNSKEVLDYWNDIIMDLLSDEHYLDYLKNNREG